MRHVWTSLPPGWTWFFWVSVGSTLSKIDVISCSSGHCWSNESFYSALPSPLVMSSLCDLPTRSHIHHLTLRVALMLTHFPCPVLGAFCNIFATHHSRIPELLIKRSVGLSKADDYALSASFRASSSSGRSCRVTYFPDPVQGVRGESI